MAPDSASLRHKLGTALSLMGDTGGAFDQFQETIRRSPDFAQAHYSLGVLLAINGRIPEAIDRFTAAVRYQPEYVEARLRLAELLRQSGRPDAALPQYERVMAIDPRAAEAQFGPLYSIRSGPWKLLMNADGSGMELYNIDDDPREQDNRVAQSPGVTKRLSAKLSTWIDRLPAPGPAVGKAMQ